MTHHDSRPPRQRRLLSLRGGLLAIGVLGAIVALGSATLHASRATAAAGAETSASPLSDYLTRKQAALKALEQKATTPTSITAKVTAESRSGVRRLRIRDYQYLSDSDRSFGGYSLGAGSWDTEVGVLASAVADEFVVQASRSGIALDGVEVVFTSHPDDAATEKTHKVRYPRNLSYTAYLETPASDEQLDTLRKAVEQNSAVLALVTEPQPISHGKVVHTPSAATRDPNLPPGLRDFLVEKRQAILRRAEEAKAGKSDPYALHARARVEPNTGLREVRTGDRDFQLIHDSSPALLGYGLAPTVEEHQLGVLGTCLTHIFEIQAATRQVVLDSLEVQVEGTLAPRAGKGITSAPRYSDIRYTVNVESPAPSADIDQLREAVEASCPVYNLLKDAQTVKGEVKRGTAPKKAA